MEELYLFLDCVTIVKLVAYGATHLWVDIVVPEAVHRVCQKAELDQIRQHLAALTILMELARHAALPYVIERLAMSHVV